MYLYYSIVIPTADSYSASFNPPPGLPVPGILVGATSAGAAVVQPLYRVLLKRSFAGSLHFQCTAMLFGSILYR